MSLFVNYWVYERDFCMVIKIRVLAVDDEFFCHVEESGASMSLMKIAGRNRIFSPSGIEAKPFENLLSLWDSKMTNFASINDLNMHNY